MGRDRAPQQSSTSPMLILLVPLAVLAAATIRTGEAACYFSIELQGQFLMQSAVAQAQGGVGGAGGGGGGGGGGGAGASAAAVRYSQVNITAEAIPIWGQCHRRLGANVILLDSSGATSCVRCFHLALRSPNVLQVHTEGLDKCYISEDAAHASCPSEAASAARARAGPPPTEIILYKTRDHLGQPVREQYCPISGRFSFTSRGGPGSGGVSGVGPGSGYGSYNAYGSYGGYSAATGPAMGVGHRDCLNAETSVVDNCPSGSQLNMHYRNCNFPDFNVTYACLGHWEATGGQRYLALLNRAVDTYPNYPRYRCALFAEEASTGAVAMAFSSDSTCHSDLRNASWGYEALQLTPTPTAPWPDTADICRFPSWAQGRWQHLQVEGHTLVYRDHNTFKTYTARCVGVRAPPDAERFLVYARTQCGEQMYRCVWLKNRSANVLEFQMGNKTSSDLDPALCSEANFRERTWITQGRLDRTRETPCPVSGEYTGVIPDAQGLCARLASDCASPESMFYAVSECTQAEVYEEREYRCLGQWEEGGLTYTYTQRRDVGTYECFVGSIVSGDEIYIKEAGEHCTRDANPLQYGMKLSRKGPCLGAPPGAFPPRARPTAPWLSSKHAPEPTKPWKPVTAPPRGTGTGGAGAGAGGGAGGAAAPSRADPVASLLLLLLVLLTPPLVDVQRL